MRWRRAWKPPLRRCTAPEAEDSRHSASLNAFFQGGKPLVANDPHLGMQIPSIWYLIGLHGGGLDVVGASLAGAPGVVIGHNDRIAWGVTNVGPDVQDLFLEKVNPDNPNQAEFQGKWEDMQDVVEHGLTATAAVRPIHAVGHTDAERGRSQVRRHRGRARVRAGNQGAAGIAAHRCAVVFRRVQADVQVAPAARAVRRPRLPLRQN